jgi:hypothetical protein
MGFNSAFKGLILGVLEKKPDDRHFRPKHVVLLYSDLSCVLTTLSRTLVIHRLVDRARFLELPGHLK